MTMQPDRTPEAESRLIAFSPDMMVKADVSEWGETPERQRSRFRDPAWYLPPVGANSASALCEIRWAAHPDAFREALKRATWAMLNRRTLVEMLERPAPFTPIPGTGP